MATTPLRPLTATGVLPVVNARYCAVPANLNPQVQTVPSLFSAKLYPDPAAMATTPVRPLTATGVLLSVFVPLPNCPQPLYPQAQTVPSLFSARVWEYP